MAEYIVEFAPSAHPYLLFAVREYIDPRCVEPIVRCRDCANYEATGNCTLHHLADGCLGEVEPDGFCKWGERRESE